MGTEAETVERVGHLVTAAGATLKDKRRPIKVIGRDGAVKKTIPHVEVIEGLLHHGGIAGALGSGVRPTIVLCEVCRCVVNVGRKGIPTRCKKHTRRKLCPMGCGKVVQRRSSGCRRCLSAHVPAETRADRVRVWQSTRHPDDRSGSAKKASAVQAATKSQAMRKAWETRRAKQAARG